MHSKYGRLASLNSHVIGKTVKISLAAVNGTKQLSKRNLLQKEESFHNILSSEHTIVSKQQTSHISDITVPLYVQIK